MNPVDFTSGEAVPRRLGRLVLVNGLLVVAILGWLWPIGLGGRMPVGGDVTQFSLGLMAVFSRALKAGRLPLWNDLWGDGFPGVGESQMGVFYPPHGLLYGLLPLELAYTTSLVLHTVWGGLGASWAARRFGVSDVGAALCGFAWATSGFFLIHLPHQWGATTGCWLPWAWGLAWGVLRGERPGRSAFWLAIVLTLQMLPGHYQLAFVTQVGLASLGLASLSAARPGRLGRASLLAIAMGGAFPLGAAQLWPTLRLARLAESRRDFEYLSGFAVSPLHLATFLAPGLFERSPLWRLVVWDPFHTSPEEYLGYVGLAPLGLAVLAAWRGSRASAEVRGLLVAGLFCLVFALGPYVPGFRVWSTWPGFSFFRAPARWMIGVSFALTVLAGLGFDGLRSWSDSGRSLRRFALAGLLLLGAVVGLVEVGLRAGESPRGSWVADAYGWVFDRLPWGEPGVFGEIAVDAARPLRDHRVEEAWARQGMVLKDAPPPIFLEQRGAIYREELGPSLALFSALGAASLLSRWPGLLQASLILLTLVDLGALGRQRRVDHGPIAPLAERSPVLAQLAAAPRGIRTIDTVRNLPMVVGAAPVSAYRTLDLPTLDGLTFLASRLPARPEEQAMVARARQLTGASLRIFEPSELIELGRLGPGASTGLAPGAPISDPSLAGWRLGVDWVAGQDQAATLFRIDKVEGGGTTAWLVPLTPSRSAAILGEWSGRPLEVIDALADARPIPLESPDPEHALASFDAEGPALLVVSILADPQWRGVWTEGAKGAEAVLGRAFGREGKGAWLAVEVPGPGRWSLRLANQADDVWLGLAVSAVSAMAWVGVALAWRVKAGRREKERT